MHVVAAGIYAYACVYVCIWLQVSGDGGEVVEKFIVQQFIWPRASMLIDLTVLAVRPNSKRLRETRPSHPAGGMRGPANGTPANGTPANGTPANGTPAHRRPEAPPCSQSCIYAVGGPLGPSAALGCGHVAAASAVLGTSAGPATHGPSWPRACMKA